MNITLTSLEALILKATHESLPCPDAAAMEAFYAIMKDSAEGAPMAAQALAARIHSPNAQESLLALIMLDRIMRRSDATFHSEIGKFRFLNEMIKLVSPKYFADRTAAEVRTRVIQLLHAWSIEYPKEMKFKVAYDMLKNQGVVKETPPPLPPEETPPPPRAKNVIFEDEEKSKLLQKLLQSKKPEDLQHANRLIKTMVREEERRTEAVSRAHEVSTTLADSAGLLRDMLERAAEASPDEEQLIHELHDSCARLRPSLQVLAGDTNTDNIDDILHTNDVLDEVFEKYNSFVAERDHKAKAKLLKGPTDNDTLLDFAGARGDAETSRIEKPKHNVIDELGDIFSSESSSNIAEPLKPVSLVPSVSDDVDLLGEPSKTEGWNELDSLGEQLLKQSLPDNAKRLDSFNSKQTKKIPMNALEKSSPKTETAPNNGVVFDLDFFTKKPEVKSRPEHVKVTLSDDIMVDISTNTPNTSTTNNITKKQECLIENMLNIELTKDNRQCDNETKTPVENKTNSIDKKEKKSDVRPLTDITVTLQSIQPSKVHPLTVFEEENGLTVVLHFCKDKPRPDVNVIVISTTSKNGSPIDDYKFQGVVPKGCKVRLLTPSSNSLPAYNPFLPPPALTQLMLVARPSPQPISLKFVITYTCEDDISTEMGEVNQLPLDDI